jgi:hypothetical protein
MAECFRMAGGAAVVIDQVRSFTETCATRLAHFWAMPIPQWRICQSLRILTHPLHHRPHEQ